MKSHSCIIDNLEILNGENSYNKSVSSVLKSSRGDIKSDNNR